MSTSQFPMITDTIRPEQIRDFLKRKGWQDREHRNKALLVLAGKHPGSDHISSVVLPADPTMDDYQSRLRETLEMISDGFGRSVQSLVDAIIHWDRDIHKIKLQSPGQREQLLPLQCATQIITKYRDFVAFAAATEASPRRFFAKLTGTGRDFAENCLFGHTFVGSFGITIECPLELPRQLPLPDLPPPRPFNRAVTERIATGFLSMSEAVRSEDPEIIVRSHLTGFSGNMCELLTEIYEYLDGREITQHISWSPELAPNHTLAAATESVKIDERSYEVLLAASSSLQKVDKSDQDKTIIGRITKLNSEKPPLDTEEYAVATRAVVIRWEMEKNQDLHIKVALPIAQYRDACDAHKNGRKMKICGKPEKQGKFWHLKDQHGFEII